MKAYGSEKVLPYNEEEQKSSQVRQMFDNIAGTYDLLNHTLSWGIDKRWRRKGIRFLQPFAPSSILDIATGTGDLAIQLHKTLKPQQIIGCDISEKMMEVARRKVEERGIADNITFETQDATALTFADNSFEAVTVAFGVRNFEQIERGIEEMYRVLKPGGHLMILELTTPEQFPMKQLYRLYSRLVIPTIGRLFSKEKAAYSYLPASIRVMPQGEEMRQILLRRGFHHAQVKRFTLGICTMYTGQKQQ